MSIKNFWQTHNIRCYTQHQLENSLLLGRPQYTAQPSFHLAHWAHLERRPKCGHLVHPSLKQPIEFQPLDVPEIVAAAAVVVDAAAAAAVVAGAATVASL